MKKIFRSFNRQHQRCRNAVYRFRGKLLTWYLRLRGCRVGAGLKCKQWPLFRQFPFANLEIGTGVNIGWRVTLDISVNGRLVLGDRVNLTQDIIISANESVTIGADSLIAEFTSIRDADHGLLQETTIAAQPFTAKSILIGRDVWIAAGCRILKGAEIADGCVIAANAVVTGRLTTEPGRLYGGVPAQYIGKRPES